MKLQCPCGAKYAFDTTPDMAQKPVKFVCPSCGLDSSEFVNQLIRQEYGACTPPPPPATLRISTAEKSAEKPTEPSGDPRFCLKHRMAATENCAVCGKPICAKCLELFGYFCGPLCKAKAEAQNMDAPVYVGRRDIVEARFWRKTGLISGIVGAIVLALVGAWTWYAWFGSVPHPVFAARFADTDRAYSGAAQIVGTDQIVFLHGGTLARYNMKTGKPVWSVHLLTQKQIDDEVKAETDEEARADAEASNGYHHRRLPQDIERTAKQVLQERLTLHVSGQNVWVQQAGKLTRYNWDTGKVAREVSLPELGGELVQSGDELLMVGAESVTHISLATGDSRVERFGEAAEAPAMASTPNEQEGGIPGIGAGGARNGQPLNPQKVEAQVQNLNAPARIALPALIGNAQYEQKLESALNDNVTHSRLQTHPRTVADMRNFQLVFGPGGVAEVSIRLLEQRLVTRPAMRVPSGKSAVDGGNVGMMNETAAINEQLNEMQRNNGGDTVTEDQSRYQVTVHLPDTSNAADWTGEVVGPPQLFVLKTVNVIAAGKTVIVLDKSNKKLWQAGLTYRVQAGGPRHPGKTPEFGEGPCVEHGDTLFVFDQAVLTAFDLNSGNARWRLPSVGVLGLFFDGKGSVYVNTTTGNPDDIKYSRQIDVTRKTEAVVFKIDAKTGKTLWSVKPGGYISYLSGDYIYTIQSYDPNPTDEEADNDMAASLQKPAYLRITRLRPSDGQIMWAHEQDRCPFYVRFDQNRIELVFKREVEVLKFLSF